MDAGPDSTAAKERAEHLRKCLHKAYDRTGHLQPAIDLIRLILKLSRIRRGRHDAQRCPPTAIDRPMTTMPARTHSTVRMAGW